MKTVYTTFRSLWHGLANYRRSLAYWQTRMRDEEPMFPAQASGNPKVIPHKDQQLLIAYERFLAQTVESYAADLIADNALVDVQQMWHRCTSLMRHEMGEEEERVLACHRDNLWNEVALTGNMRQAAEEALTRFRVMIGTPQTQVA